MQRKRSPHQDKALDYQRQRRGFAEYAHSMRHGKWRRRKRRPAQKSERQSERLALIGGETNDPGFDAAVSPRPRVKKWSTASLAEWVTSRKATRAARANRRAPRRPRAK